MNSDIAVCGGGFKAVHGSACIYDISDGASDVLSSLHARSDFPPWGHNMWLAFVIPRHP